MIPASPMSKVARGKGKIVNLELEAELAGREHLGESASRILVSIAPSRLTALALL